MSKKSLTHKDDLMSQDFMDVETAATCFQQFGNPHRLAIIRALVRAGNSGLSVGEIQKDLPIAKSTLSHHLLHLMKAGLVEQTREGRVLRCRLIYPEVQRLIDFLMKDCCEGLHDLKDHVA